MIAFTQAQARAVVTAARHIEHAGPAILTIAARALAAGLALTPVQHRRTVALAVAEIALRDARPTGQPANTRSPA
jgi:hypothetical protein